MTKWPLLTSIFSQVLKVTKKIFSQGDYVSLIDIENNIDLIAFFLRDRGMSQVGVSKAYKRSDKIESHCSMVLFD